MHLKIKLKPIRVTGQHKLTTLDKINTHHIRSWGNTHSNCLVPFNRNGSEVVRVYSLEKRNKKVERKRKGDKTTSKVISPAHWVGHYYDIPMSLLDIAKLKVVQYDRHFELTPR